MTLVADMTALLSDPFFAEEVWYLPESAPPRKIQAVIDREVLAAEGSVEIKTIRTRRILHISRDPIEGVAVIKKYKDKFEFNKDIGDDALTSFRVSGILSQDRGAYSLEVLP